MKKAVFSLLVLTILVGCAIPPSHFGYGILGDTVEPIAVTSNSSAMRESKVCGYNYLGLVDVGDISIEWAKKTGRITSVSSIDKEINRYVVVSKVCTIVKGN